MATCDCVQPHCIIILLCAKRGEWSINILNCLNELKSFHHFSPYPLFLLDQPERTALVFLGGVCVGLLVTLGAIVFQIHCRADCHYRNSSHPHHRHRKRHHQRHHHSCPHHQPVDSNPDSTAVVTSGGTGRAGDSESEDWDETSDLSARRRRRFERALLHATMFTSAEGISHTHVTHMWRLVTVIHISWR